MMKTAMRSFVAAAVSVAALAWVTDLKGASVTATFTGTSPGDWNTGTNWSGSRVPGSDTVTYDYAVIDNKIVTLAADMAGNTLLNTVTIKGGGELQINSGGNLPVSDGENWDQGWLKVGDGGTAGSVIVNTTAPNGISIKETDIGMGGNASFTLTNGLVRNRGRDVYMGGNGYTVTASFDGGTFYSSSPYGTRVAYGSNSQVTVSQNGGTYTAISTGTQTWLGAGANSSATWNLQSGTLNLGPTILGYNATGIGNLIQTGGNFYNGNIFAVGGSGTGFYSISGGTFDTAQQVSTPDGNKDLAHKWGNNNTSVGTGTGQGTFEVIGSAGTVKVASYWGGGTEILFTLGANGTLAYVIDGATVTPIEIEGRDSAAGQDKQASLAGLIDLQLSGYTPGIGDTYNLLTASTVLDNGFALAPGVGKWELSIAGTAGSGQILQATYIPEPTALVVFGLGAAGMLRRRTRQQIKA